MINDGPEVTHSFQKIPQYSQEIYDIKATVSRFFGVVAHNTTLIENRHRKEHEELAQIYINKIQTLPDKSDASLEFNAATAILNSRHALELQTAKLKYNTDNLEKELFKRLGELTLILCGGAVTSAFTGNSVADLDFYIEDKTKIEAAKIFLGSFFNGEAPFVTTNAITFKRRGKGNKIWCAQLITRFTGKPEEIFKTFDFTITQSAYRFSEDVLYFGDRFFVDIGKRLLVYLGHSSYPICAMHRTLKYQKRGYKLPGSTIMHIALHILQLDIKNYHDLKDQLMGIDTMYLQNLFDQDKIGSVKMDAPLDYGEFLDKAFSEMNLAQLAREENEN